MMNNRLFDQKNKKDEFLVEQLLPYLLERIEKTENTKNTENTQNKHTFYPQRLLFSAN